MLEARVGFEPTNGGFADQSWFSILLVRLAFTPAHLADFALDLGPIVPKLFPSFGVNPCSETKNWAHLQTFIQLLPNPAARRVVRWTIARAELWQFEYCRKRRRAADVPEADSFPVWLQRWPGMVRRRQGVPYRLASGRNCCAS